MRGWRDQDVERMLGILLRTGVVLAAAVVLLGGVPYLARYGSAVPEYRVFHGEPSDLRTLSGIVRDALARDPRGVIQFGLLLLVATPVARVAFSLIAFLREGDLVYVGVTLVVLAVLLYSVVGGGF